MVGSHLCTSFFPHQLSFYQCSTSNIIKTSTTGLIWGHIFRGLTPPLKLLTQNLFPWWLANDTTWIIHQSPCFYFWPSNHGFLELLNFKFLLHHYHHHHHHYKSLLMTLSVTNFNTASAAAQFWLKTLVAFISSSGPVDFKLLTRNFVTKIEFLWKPRRAKVFVMGAKMNYKLFRTNYFQK